MKPVDSSRPLVLISWNGQHPPLQSIHVDTSPQFDLLIFDYSGQGSCQATPLDLCIQGRELPVIMVSVATECKGQIFQWLAQYLQQQSCQPQYLGLIDDDILLSFSSINRLLHIGRQQALDVFSPSLTHDSFFSHRWMLQRGQRHSRPVPWVEVMMPFYNTEVFMQAAPLFQGFVTSWGFDQYLFPTVQKIMGRQNSAIIDAVAATHHRPITSQHKKYSSGMNGKEEHQAVKALCMALIAREHPELRGTAWYRQTFERKYFESPARRAWQALGRPLRKWLDQSL